jgi:nucleotide-binding universal stress UspA family protein
MVKIERILCPVDLTHESEAALRYAVALARVYEAKLILCHCGGRSSAFAPDGGGEKTGRRLKTMFEDALARHLGMADFSRLDWEGFLLEGDDPGAAVTRKAAECRADLIVMRSRHRPLGAALLGSTAETVCRTDLHVVEGELPVRLSPVIPGHQVVGRVAKVGSRVEDFKEGERVGVAWLHRTCGVCRFCRIGSATQLLRGR